MKKRFLLLIIFVMFLFTTGSFFVIINYLDPYQNLILWLITLIFSFLFSLSSFFSLIIYFIKKIYHRGNVYIFHVLESFRQGFFIGLFILGVLSFLSLWVLNFLTFFLLFIILFFLELFLQNIWEKE